MKANMSTVGLTSSRINNTCLGSVTVTFVLPYNRFEPEQKDHSLDGEYTQDLSVLAEGAKL